jgi:putative endonuclease
LASKYNGTLYIGVTNNLERRVFEHKTEMNEGFTKRYGIKRLVYFEKHNNIKEALRREKNMKKWKRQWKIDLIEKENPKWDDLSSDWSLNAEV